MPELIQHLAWDSDFFGIQIGRIDLDGATHESLTAIDREARERGFACLYASLDPDPPQTSHLAQEHGYRLLEAGIMFGLAREVPTIPTPAEISVRYGGPDDLPHLRGFLDRVAPWSRFAVDPRFGPDAALRLHHAWVERAADPDSEDWQLVIAEDDDGMVAFSTQTAQPQPRIDFICAVRAASGAPQALVEFGRAWAGDSLIEGGEIAARNIASVRFVELCGYRFLRTTYHFHQWFDDEAVINSASGQGAP